MPGLLGQTKQLASTGPDLQSLLKHLAGGLNQDPMSLLLPGTKVDNTSIQPYLDRFTHQDSETQSVLRLGEHPQKKVLCSLTCLRIEDKRMHRDHCKPCSAFLVRLLARCRMSTSLDSSIMLRREQVRWLLVEHLTVCSVQGLLKSVRRLVGEVFFRPRFIHKVTLT